MIKYQRKVQSSGTRGTNALDFPTSNFYSSWHVVGFPSTHTHSFEPWALVDRSSLTLASVCVLWSSSPQIYFHRYYTFPTPEPHVKTVEVVEGWIPDPHIYLCSRASAAFSLLWLHCSRFKNVQSSDSLWCCSSAPCVCGGGDLGDVNSWRSLAWLQRCSREVASGGDITVLMCDKVPPRDWTSSRWKL